MGGKSIRYKLKGSNTSCMNERMGENTRKTKERRKVKDASEMVLNFSVKEEAWNL